MCTICDAVAKGATRAEAFAQAEQDMLDTIHLHGLSLTGVVDAEPPFVYSAGRTLQNLPELFMVGYAEIPQFAGIINNVHEAQTTEGLHVHDGDVLDGFLGRGYQLAVRRADPVKAEMNATLHLFRDSGLEVQAFQLVWPDIEGRFPWDDGWDSERWVQPLYPAAA